MKKLKMFCLTIDNSHLNKIKKFDYIPVGLGKNIISNKFLRDNTGENISEKNPFYGEYTFHYWLWKNKLNELNDTWIGFCQYRKFWSEKNLEEKVTNLSDLNNKILKNIPQKYELYESIIGEPFLVNQLRLTKFIKKNFKKMVLNPSLFFDNSKRNIKFHFDMMHGDGNLDKAINLLDADDRKDFSYFVNSEVSFNPHNMFICNSKNVLIHYYNAVFPWLERCEKIFGFNLEGYGMRRIYGFLAERFLSYWLRKYTRFATLPIIFTDISELN